MKYKAVKEINMCDGCINFSEGKCGDFKKQRIAEGLPCCDDGIIYIGDSAAKEYKDITLDWTIKEIMALDLDRVEILHDIKWIKSIAGTNEELAIDIINGDICRYKLKPLEPIRITQELMDDLLDCISNKEGLEKRYGRKLEIIE